MSLDVNPTNPLNIAGFSHSMVLNSNTRYADVFYTLNGGVTWNATRIGNAEDGIIASGRFDPSIAFDAVGTWTSRMALMPQGLST